MSVRERPETPEAMELRPAIEKLRREQRCRERKRMAMRFFIFSRSLNLKKLSQRLSGEVFVE